MEHLSPEEMDERQRLVLVRDSTGGPAPPPPVAYEEEQPSVDEHGNEVYFTSGVSYKPAF